MVEGAADPDVAAGRVDGPYLSVRHIRGVGLLRGGGDGGERRRGPRQGQDHGRGDRAAHPPPGSTSRLTHRVQSLVFVASDLNPFGRLISARTMGGADRVEERVGIDRVHDPREAERRPMAAGGAPPRDAIRSGRGARRRRRSRRRSRSRCRPSRSRASPNAAHVAVADVARSPDHRHVVAREPVVVRATANPSNGARIARPKVVEHVVAPVRVVAADGPALTEVVLVDRRALHRTQRSGRAVAAVVGSPARQRVEPTRVATMRSHAVLGVP